MGLDQIVARIAALAPANLLEIGCGTGLLLHRLAGSCRRYCGTDFSGTVLDQLRAGLADRDNGACEIELRRQAAADRTGITPGFDTVVINSVAQYFPSLAYLGKVLDGAFRLLHSSGHIFVGDVRHAGLLEMFHTAVALHQAEASMPLKQLRRVVAQNMRRESELLVDPAYFLGLRRTYPQITHIEILPKDGGTQNELTRFRYDVVIAVGTAAQRNRAGVAALDRHGGRRRTAVARGPRHRGTARGPASPPCRGACHRDPAAQHAGRCDRQRSAARASKTRGRRGRQAHLLALGRDHGYAVWFATASGKSAALDVVFQREARPVDWSAARAQVPPGADGGHLSNQPYRSGGRKPSSKQSRSNCDARCRTT